ncbi:hypothetical protein M1D93_05190 [Arthrobacter sp. Z1-9]
MDAACARGAVPPVRWEPWAWSGGCEAEWNKSLVPYLAAQPVIIGFVRFRLWKEA